MIRLTQKRWLGRSKKWRPSRSQQLRPLRFHRRAAAPRLRFALGHRVSLPEPRAGSCRLVLTARASGQAGLGEDVAGLSDPQAALGCGCRYAQLAAGSSTASRSEPRRRPIPKCFGSAMQKIDLSCAVVGLSRKAKVER